MDVKGSYMVLGGTSLISLGIGIVSGYFVARKQLEAEYVAITEKEIAEAKDFYSALNKKGKYATPKSAAKDLLPDDLADESKKTRHKREQFAKTKEAAQAVRDYRGESKKKAEEQVENDQGNIENFISPDGFDYDEEIKLRTPHAPYIITKEEFFENEDEFEQVSVTYFLDDDVVSDGTDEPIDNVDDVLGEENIVQFGKGSGDPHIVYIRNEKLMLDFEVLKDESSFGEKIRGFMAHTNARSSRKRDKKIKFKRGDDE
jgi:hypothetical protein